MNSIEILRGYADDVAGLLKIMAHPERLLVLCQLAHGEVAARTLQQNSQLGPSAFSQHLALLRNEQLVSCRKEAQQVFYALSDARAQQVIEALQQVCLNPSIQS